MRNSKVVFCGVISLYLLVLLAGCASKPLTSADQMRMHATDVQEQMDLKNQFAKDWEKGSKLVLSGEKRVKSGESDLKKAQDDIERGRREIAEGQKLIHESEKQFRENFPDLEIRSDK